MGTVSRTLLVLYSLLLALLVTLTAPWWLWQMVRTGKYREGLLDRLGRIPVRLAHAPGRGAIWLHAVSVGEVLAASRLVADLEQALPDATLYISTTTRTGQELARERFGDSRVFYFPLDFAFAVRAWLRYLRPALVILVESEFWPRMLLECVHARIPVAVVNARVSDRSWPRYQRLRPLWRPLLGSLSLVLAQSEQDALRLRALGATTAAAAGNLKYDIRVTHPAAVTARLRARLPAQVPVIVCGSTLAGEEEMLLAALPVAGIVTVLAPRHPERFDEVAHLLAARKVPYARRSSLIAERSLDTPVTPGTVILLDSVGELASLYSLATVAILGGGFLHPGGHNPLEPAQFAVPVLMGSQYANFRAVVEALQAEQAVVISDGFGLRSTVGKLLADPERCRAIGARGRQVFEQQAGATRYAVGQLLALLAREAAAPGPRPAPGSRSVPPEESADSQVLH